MISLVVVSHGTFSKGLTESAELIMGEQENVTAIGFNLGDNIEELRAKVRNAVTEARDRGDEVLVLTDIKSGSPFNVTVAAMCEMKFKHITGINLPTYLEILGVRDFMTLDEIMETIIEQGRESIEDMSDLFKD